MGKKSQLPLLVKVTCLLLTAAILAWAIIVKPPAGTNGTKRDSHVPKVFDPLFVHLMPEEVARLPIATRFDYPMGSEGGALIYNARPFREVGHLGDDFNGIGGTDSDLGDPIYAVGAGEVVYVGTPSPGWGTVVIVAHRVPADSSEQKPAESETAKNLVHLRVIQSFYAHLEDIRVFVGQVVQRGDRLGCVGPAAVGSNYPHLHFELRESRAIAPGVGYADSAMDRLNPEKFFAKYRGAPEELLNQAPKETARLPDVRLEDADEEKED